jgi:hypothetical protein
MKNYFLFVLMAVFCISCSPGIPKQALEWQPETLADRQIQTRRFDTANHEAMLNAASSVLQDLGFSLDESEYSLGVLVGSKTRDATSGAQVAGAILMAALTGAMTAVDSHQVVRVSMVMREITDEKAKNASSVRNHNLSPEVIAVIKRDVEKAISNGLKTKYPNEVSTKIALQIAENTAQTLTKDLTILAGAKYDSGKSTVRVTFQRIIFNNMGQVTRNEQIKDPEVYKQFFEKLSKSVFLEAHSI